MDKIIIGITGKSGSGKSTLAKSFSTALVIDADLIAKELMQKNSPLALEVGKNFPVLEDGEINRKKLADIVFSDSEKLKLLNSITHPVIKSEIENIIKKSDKNLIIIDAAALIESGIHEICDKVILVEADKEVRLRRIMERDRLTYDEALKRIMAQTTADFEFDLVIKNS